jgi:hypothetical protein
MDWNLYLAVASIGLRLLRPVSYGGVPAARGRGIRKACPSKGEPCPETLRNAKAPWTQGIGTAVCRMRKLVGDRTVGSCEPDRSDATISGSSAGGRRRDFRVLLDRCNGISKEPGRVRWQEAAMNPLGHEPRRRYWDVKGMRVLRAR